jgi:hypothetical protein
VLPSSRISFALTILALAIPAAADPRPFTFTNDAYPMGKGQWEIEQWVTYSGERESDSEFMRFEFRTEFELGLADNFDLAIYLPEWRIQDSSAGDETEFQGGAIEAIFYLTNPVKDFLGIALYGEMKIHDNELEFEQKLILHKDIGKWTLAYNLVLETEIEGVFEDREENEIEGALKNTFGVAYAFAPGWSGGGELVVSSVYSDWENYEGTSIHAGPVISYQGGKFGDTGVWWVTLTPTFQLTDEEDQADVVVRMIFGIGL